LGLCPRSWGEFVVEVTRGQDDAIPIAIVPFMPADAAASLRCRAGGERRSGAQRPLQDHGSQGHDREPHTGANIGFDDWRRLGNDYIVVGQMQPQGADRYNISFELYNVLNRQRLLGYQISANRAGLRLASHQIADMVFDKISGIRGAFATRIAYVSVLGMLPNRTTG
jgi:TolB protein